MYAPVGQRKLLTMDQISQNAAAQNASLVVLSACETGMTDVAHPHLQDQFVGLPAAFLQGGAKTVVVLTDSRNATGSTLGSSATAWL